VKRTLWFSHGSDGIVASVPRTGEAELGCLMANIR
jgi:hypothetical protein